MNRIKNLTTMIAILLILAPVNGMNSGGSNPFRNNSSRDFSGGNRSLSERSSRSPERLASVEQEMVDRAIAQSLVEEEQRTSRDGNHLRVQQIADDTALAQRLEQAELATLDHEDDTRRSRAGQQNRASRLEYTAPQLWNSDLSSSEAASIDSMTGFIFRAFDNMIEDIETRSSASLLILALDTIPHHFGTILGMGGIRGKIPTIVNMYDDRATDSMLTFVSRSLAIFNVFPNLLNVGAHRHDLRQQIEHCTMTSRGQGYIIYALSLMLGNFVTGRSRDLCRELLIQRPISQAIPQIVLLDRQDPFMNELRPLIDEERALLIEYSLPSYVARNIPGLVPGIVQHPQQSQTTSSTTSSSVASRASQTSAVLSENTLARAIPISGATSECPICMVTDKADVKTSCCLHALCRECWNASVRSTARSYRPGSCPFCRQEAQL